MYESSPIENNNNGCKQGGNRYENNEYHSTIKKQCIITIIEDCNNGSGDQYENIHYG